MPANPPRRTNRPRSPSRSRWGKDPALQESSSFERDPYLSFSAAVCNAMDGSPQKRLKSSVHNSPTVSDSKTVTFYQEVLVIEFDRVDRRGAKDVWWTMREMEGFRHDANTSKCKYRRFGVKKSARCQNHIRRLIFQQNASAEMDGITDPMYLATISLESSRRSRELAIQSARKMEKEVEDDLCLHSRISNTVCFGPNRWIADYYLGTVFETISDSVSCGEFIP